jgi:protocatechuate 3,4-dioxygenase beta subunit
MVENCIARGLLVAGVSTSSTNLLAMWEEGQAKALTPTPTEVLGPFFKKGAPNATNLRAPGDAGFPLRVAGKVWNTRGDKVPGAIVEMWQADAEGRYDVKGYRYRTKLQMEASAEYNVETVMPGHYSDRPAQHIHYMITAPGHRPLVTQIYFATDPWFEGDPDKNYGKRSLVTNRELVRPVKLFEGPGTPRVEVIFDICLEKA